MSDGRSVPREWREEHDVLDQATRRQLIERYREGYDEVVHALQGIDARELDARPGAGTWSAREIVHHLADSEMTSAIRLRRLLAEDRPVIQGYDQEEFARRLYYDRPIDASLEAFRYARASTVELLDRLTPEQWAREGLHSESGAYSVERWLGIYAQHAHGHADQIRRARASAGAQRSLPNDASRTEPERHPRARTDLPSVPTDQ